MNSTMQCPLCEKKAKIKFHHHVGYQSSLTFNIHHCYGCETAFADPLEVNDDLYNLIYSQSADVPGYERYLRYAKEAKTHHHPLQYLADEEDIYWAIQSYLASKPKHLKILEVGSGLGYLTYALHKEGYNVKGIDISHIAVEDAKQRYGDYFICEDIIELSKTDAKYDIVILTEVIEHIPNVISFLKAIHKVLIPGGDLVLTTPNKTPFHRNVVWDTEPPPVHLWWFSEKSLLRLGKKLGFEVSFVDFQEYNKVSPHHPFTKISNQPTRGPRLDPNGKVIKSASQSNQTSPLQESYVKKSIRQVKSTSRKAIKTILSGLGLWKPLEKILRPHLKRRHTLCAIFSKK